MEYPDNAELDVDEGHRENIQEKSVDEDKQTKDNLDMSSISTIISSSST